VEAKEFGFTKSHQIAVNASEHGGGVKAAQALETNDIIVNYNMLPWDTDPRNPSGLRIGVPEMTRFGMEEADMQRLGNLIAECVKGKTVKDEVNKLRGEFQELHYV
jgi:glycine hydroxymethyltransferase